MDFPGSRHRSLQSQLSSELDERLLPGSSRHWLFETLRQLTFAVIGASTIEMDIREGFQPSYSIESCRASNEMRAASVTIKKSCVNQFGITNFAATFSPCLSRVSHPDCRATQSGLPVG